MEHICTKSASQMEVSICRTCMSGCSGCCFVTVRDSVVLAIGVFRRHSEFTHNSAVIPKWACQNYWGGPGPPGPSPSYGPVLYGISQSKFPLQKFKDCTITWILKLELTRRKSNSKFKLKNVTQIFKPGIPPTYITINLVKICIHL